MHTSFISQVGDTKIYQSLKDGEIHIFLAHPDYVESSDESLLNATERSRASAFKFFSDRKRYVAAHSFLRQTLSKYAPLLPATWRFTTNGYGKPSIANNGYEWLQFNLSHTHGLIACAISYQREVGIDVEKRKALMDLESLCQYAFSAPEAADILSLANLQAREQRFFTYWTLKEAYVKARGMGLSIPLQQFTFIEGVNKEWSLHCDPALQDDGKNWQFSSYIMNDHHLSIGVPIDPAIMTSRMRFNRLF
ncbi:MAG: 4'-phosphopantetheinyl transferase (EC [uncultured Thiotrichaceae bacterium]|uniref:4'-phosphopantetheinyl transferase (EC) n=1 Tax=uncultured Thiotrichaceae bacterium TaxID=298394 RepID=A0A6S6UFB9_9GAMM|nr:MAG: 4'-phosphopantetheinyl transferase (EC [uncultured Thiotrichaceae bacterium]